MEISLEHPNTQSPNAKHSLYFPTPLGLVSLLSVEVITDSDKKYKDNDKDNDNDNVKDNVKDNDKDNDNDNVDNDIDNNGDNDVDKGNDNGKDGNNNNNKKQQGKTTVRLMICTPFAKVVATLKVEQAFSDMVPIVANKPEEQLKDSILHNLSYTELDQFQDNGSLISLDENFIKYNDDDRNRANSIISTSSAFSCLPSDNNSSLKLMVPGIYSNSRVDYLRSRQSEDDDNIKLVERSKLTGTIEDKNNNNDSNNDIPPLTIDTEPVSFVQSFLSLFSPSRKVSNNHNNDSNDSNGNNDNPDIPITPENYNPDTPTTFNRQLNPNRKLSWSENTKIKDDENFFETRVRRDSISSQATMATDDGTFVSYYTFQSNVIKALLYEV